MQCTVADLPDEDWVADQVISDDAVNVYTLWSGRAAIEITAVWWNADAAPAGVGAAVYDAEDVGLQLVEVKRVEADDRVPGVSEFTAIVAAAPTQTAPAFEKQSASDTSPDAMYVRVSSATAPGSATHLRLLVEVTP